MAKKFVSGLPLTTEERPKRSLEDALREAEEAIVKKRRKPDWPYGAEGTPETRAIDDRLMGEREEEAKAA